MREDDVNWYGLADDAREALDMIALKMSRIIQSNDNQVDSWHDKAGYATLVENRIKAEAEKGGVKGRARL